MADSNCEISRCGLCRFYTHEGRRGGQCSRLSAPVNARWSACCFADAPFTDSSQPSLGIAELMTAPEQINAGQISPVLISANPSRDALKKTVCSAR